MVDWEIPADVILENILDAVIVLDVKGRVVVWNRAAEETYGWSRHEVLGLDLLELIPVLRYLDGRTHEQVLAEFYARGVWQGRAMQPHRDGHLLTVASSVRLLRDADGAPRNLIAVNRDITAQVRMETELQLSEARFQAQFRNSPIPTMIWRYGAGDFELLDVNPAAKVFSQGKLPAYLGVKASIILNDSPHLLDEFFHAHHEQTMRHQDVWWTMVTTGERLFLSIHFAPVPPDLVMVHAFDFTSLRRALELAEEASRAKSEFLSSMSHELRTPLQTILGFTQLLDDDLTVPAQQEYASHVLSAGEHLLTLINEVLDITRIETRGMKLTLRATPLVALVAEAVTFVRPQLMQRRMTLRSVGEQDELVMADAQRLKQVVLNLLSNAIKYNQEDGWVEIRWTRSPGWMRVSVVDSGPGIAPNLLHRLFTPFDRLGAEHSAIGGIGLGLALSKQLIEHMHGRLGVESVLGQGSTFWLELPLAP